MPQEVGIKRMGLKDTPIAVLDFETTGLTAGVDRVAEVSVVRVDPGTEPRLAFDTLVNPMRPMAATEIHGITDDDVAGAPRFEAIAGNLLRTLSGCVLAAYNVYFDMKFLDFELRNAGVIHDPPHFCLMYMRPMLGLGERCKLAEACRQYGIDHEISHFAAHDALASGQLLRVYLKAAADRGVHTFGQLARLKKYKFTRSFANDPFPDPSGLSFPQCERLCSRVAHEPPIAADPLRAAFAAYWDAIKTVVADLEITDDEVAYVVQERKRLGLTAAQIRFIHAKVFASIIARFAEDKDIDDRETRKLRRLRQCLSRLGWAPGD
jgi:DNA polymerase-3 subunit epsilon